jgi:hypothetical protein
MTRQIANDKRRKTRNTTKQSLTRGKIGDHLGRIGGALRLGTFGV